MERLIKLNEIIKKVSPDVEITFEDRLLGKSGIFIKVKERSDMADKSKDFMDNISKHFLRGATFSRYTPIKVKNDKFIFNLHYMGVRLYVHAEDDVRLEELIRLLVKGYLERYNLEDYRFIMNNLKKSKRVKADINNDKLDITIHDDTMLSLDVIKLETLFMRGHLESLTNMGSSKKKKEKKNGSISKLYIDKLLTSGIIKGSNGGYVLPISYGLDIPVRIRHDKHIVIVEFTKPHNMHSVLSGAIIMSDDDLNILISIINGITSQTSPVNRFAEAVKSLLGYDVEVTDYSVIISNDNNMKLVYNIDEHRKFFNDLNIILNHIEPDANHSLVRLAGHMWGDSIDIISGRKFSDRAIVLRESAKESDLNSKILKVASSLSSPDAWSRTDKLKNDDKIEEVTEDGE